jgi:hypothetical protein
MKVRSRLVQHPQPAHVRRSGFSSLIQPKHDQVAAWVRLPGRVRTDQHHRGLRDQRVVDELPRLGWVTLTLVSTTSGVTVPVTTRSLMGRMPAPRHEKLRFVRTVPVAGVVESRSSGHDWQATGPDQSAPLPSVSADPAGTSAAPAHGGSRPNADGTSQSVSVATDPRPASCS